MDATTGVRVVYWVGNRQTEGLASTYAEAMTLASRNCNTSLPQYYDAATGRQLFDDGNGLRGEDDDTYTI